MTLIVLPAYMPLSLLPPEASRGLGQSQPWQGRGLLRHRHRRPGGGDAPPQGQRCLAPPPPPPARPLGTRAVTSRPGLAGSVASAAPPRR